MTIVLSNSRKPASRGFLSNLGPNIGSGVYLTLLPVNTVQGLVNTVSETDGSDAILLISTRKPPGYKLKIVGNIEGLVAQFPGIQQLLN